MDNIRKSQGSIEFLIIFSASLFFFTILIIAVYSNVQEKERLITETNIKNLALTIQDEINLAIAATEGYSRNFTVPLKINSQNYELNVSGGRVYVYTEKYYIAYPVPEIKGLIKKGENIIKKQDGEVRLN